jgi:hypothetical protein
MYINFGCAASLATLDKLVDRFSLPPAALPIGDTSLTHVMKLVAHSTKPPTPTTIIYNDRVETLFLYYKFYYYCSITSFPTDRLRKLPVPRTLCLTLLIVPTLTSLIFA